MNDTNFHSIHEAVTELFLLKIISSFFNSQVFPVLVVNSLCKTCFNFLGAFSVFFLSGKTQLRWISRYDRDVHIMFLTEIMT